MGDLSINKLFQSVQSFFGGSDAVEPVANESQSGSGLALGDSVTFESAETPGLFDRFSAPMSSLEPSSQASSSTPAWLAEEPNFTPADPAAFFDHLALQPLATRPPAEAKIEDGLLLHDKVEARIYDGLHHGDLEPVQGLVVHQTDAPSAEHTFNKYESSNTGAHFLVAKDGTLYQTSRLDQKAWHVGKLRSRCYELHDCSSADQKAAYDVYHEPGKSYGARVKALHQHELAKDYPDRYPSNDDSIGIELVGDYLESTSTYETVTDEQNESLQWLTGQLKTLLGLDGDDVYRHPDVSYKQPSEASTADWEGN